MTSINGILGSTRKKKELKKILNEKNLSLVGYRHGKMLRERRKRRERDTNEKNVFFTTPHTISFDMYMYIYI